MIRRLMAAAAILLLIPVIGISALGPVEPHRSPCRLALETGASAGAPDHFCWALIGNDGMHLAEEFNVGIRYKVLDLNWSAFSPTQDALDANYVRNKRTELAALRDAGFGVILNLGFHDPPAWIHELYVNSYYVNQYGDVYAETGDAGDANLIFNLELRRLAAAYIQQVFAEFGAEFAAVRLGGGRYGELTYPPVNYQGKPNCYWAFDPNALALTPTPDWRPGDAAYAGEARQFINWYLDELVNFENWQIAAVRSAGYSGALMMLFPSWGIRPGDLDAAISGDLTGSTSAEVNGEIQRGYDFARQIAAIHDPRVIVTTTWLDANPAGDDHVDPGEWSAVKFLAKLAHQHPLHLSVFGENTGQGSLAAMALSAAQAQRYGLIGIAWFNEPELFSRRYATLDDYRHTIAAYSPPA